MVFHHMLREIPPQEVPMIHNMVLEIDANKRYGATLTEDEFIRSPRDFIDLLAWGTENGTDLYLMRDTNFSETFYDLSTGLAGEILQKVSNYRVRLAIVGTFEMVGSKRFREFISESNKGSSVCFLQERAKALVWLLS
jgi:hypothetical protein